MNLTALHYPSRFRRYFSVFLLVGALGAAAFRMAAAESPTRPAAGLIETTLVDAGASYYGTFQSHNQKVVATPDGIFLTYSRQRVPPDAADSAPEAALWRLVRSTDGGKTFQTVYESTHGTRAPVLEVDDAGRLFLAHPDWNDPRAPFFFYRFARGGDYHQPSISVITNISCAAKYAMAWDPTRRQFYIAAQYGQLVTVNPEGRLVEMRAAFRQTGPNASTQYPHLAVSPDGVLHLAMTTVGKTRQGKDIYWDIHYMNSPDGGRTWRKLDGTPLPASPVPDDTGPTDRITLDDEFEISTWLASTLVKDGKVHFIYEGKTMHYLRYDLATGRKDATLDGPQFSGGNLTLGHASGLLAARLDQPGSPMFCVSRDRARQTLGCLMSRDNGRTWEAHSLAARTFHDNYATGGARQVAGDGYLIGSFTEVAGPKRLEIWFYRIQTGPIR